jgi:hypothetical protein
MKHLLLGALALIAAPAAAADYLPVGPQQNVSIGTVTGGGWSLCYSATMGTIFGSSAATTLANCTGDRVMMAGRATGSDTLLVLAQTTFDDAFANTGAADNGIFTNSNGADWFYADNWSWGFKTPGTSYTKFECDPSPPGGSMCIHTLSFVGGYNINEIGGLNSSSDYEKLVFTYNGDGGAVPEPAAWALMIAGFGLVGAAARRQRDTRVSA